MTPTRWLIAAFWVVVLVMCAKSFYDYNQRLEREQTALSEKHYFPPPLPGAPVVTQAQGADVRQVSYIPTETPQQATFTAVLVIKNFGEKKATNIQVRVQPYMGTGSTQSAPGPDEVMNPNTVDTMANTFQWVEFPDLAPGQSATQTLSFPVRTDAEPRTHFEPQINFETAKDAP